MHHGISFAELQSWIASEWRQYESWFGRQPPQVWTIAAGTGRLATIRDVLHHVAAVDVRLSQRAQGVPIATDADLAAPDAASLFTLGRRGQTMLAAAAGLETDLETVVTWQTQTGATMRASRRKIVAHALTHHIRHMAQVATILRQQGHPTDWTHDLLVSDALV